jgi:hypothetical protein
MADSVRIKGFQKKSAEPPPVEAAKADLPPKPAFKAPAPSIPRRQAAVPTAGAAAPAIEPEVTTVAEPAQAPARPVVEEVRGVAPAYTPDLDEMRVWKRQNWKWDLYVKSGLQKEEAEQGEA